MAGNYFTDGYENNGSPCVEYVNPDWESESVGFFTQFTLNGLPLTNGQKDLLDSIIKIAKGVGYEYIVVSGTPSNDLDANGRKEISAGSSLTDTRLFGKTVKMLVASSGTLTRQYLDITENVDSLTVAANNGAYWGQGDIIIVYYV
jgi:hypothetical protein